MAAPSDDFSTNQSLYVSHVTTDVAGSSAPSSLSPSPAKQGAPAYHRHALSFEDGNLALLAEDRYFIIHQGLLCRHSQVMQQMLVESTDTRRLFDRPVLELDEKWTDLGCFLGALYDGVTPLTPSIEDWAIVSAILRLGTKYGVAHLRTELLRKLSPTWPRNLLAWDMRESNATNAGLYKPRAVYPHPIMMIPLFREIGADDFLPAAFYDLSRCVASDIVQGWSYPADPTTSWSLPSDEIMTCLKGKEQASRFLSTFIVNELEGREPSQSCIYRNDPTDTDGLKRRICPAAFEAVTFEIVRDCNGVVCHRITDPLFAILDAYLMQKRENPIGRGKITFRACDFCREEFAQAVETARNTLWQKLPGWFGVKVETWPQMDEGFVDIIGFEDEPHDRFDDNFAMHESLDLDSEFEGLSSSPEADMETSETTLIDTPEEGEHEEGEGKGEAEAKDEYEDEDGREDEPMDKDQEEADVEDPRAIGIIEDMVLDFLTQLNRAAYGDPSASDDESSDEEESQTAILKKKGKARPRIEIRLADRKKPVDKEGKFATRTIRYPRAAPSGSARPLAHLFRVLDVAHEALVTEVPTTKRDIYYKDVPLFKSQPVVNQLVDDLAATWELKRSDLNIGGIERARLGLRDYNPSVLWGELTGNDAEGFNIPVGEDIESFSIDDDLAWVLVAEKEAVFQTLCRIGITAHPLMPGRGLAITGKGYGDIATRHLVSSLSDALPRTIPVTALVDCDPHGVDILSVYRYGSKSMQHENDSLAAPRIKWLGLRTSELPGLGIDYDSLLPITKQDEKKILAMLRRPNLPRKWKMELMRCLHLRRKAEIEIISASNLGEGTSVHPLLAYLSAKMTEFVEDTAGSQASATF
ncbi:hypothetical protein NMY22_g17732 [Coprinellus aureogranulatus]|nr:hypothetical protein NMY22_g17732 [Coprinellus aureogranulatus]